MERFTVGIVVFPGSNCDRDVSWALEACLDIKTKYLWHESSDKCWKPIDSAGLELVIISFDEKSIKTFKRKIKEKFKVLSDPKIRI